MAWYGCGAVCFHLFNIICAVASFPFFGLVLWLIYNICTSCVFEIANLPSWAIISAVMSSIVLGLTLLITALLELFDICSKKRWGLETFHTLPGLLIISGEILLLFIIMVLEYSCPKEMEDKGPLIVYFYPSAVLLTSPLICSSFIYYAPEQGTLLPNFCSPGAVHGCSLLCVSCTRWVKSRG